MEDSTRSNLTRKLVNDCHKRVGKVVLKVKTFIRFQTSQLSVTSVAGLASLCFGLLVSASGIVLWVLFVSAVVGVFPAVLSKLQSKTPIVNPANCKLKGMKYCVHVRTIRIVVGTIERMCLSICFVTDLMQVIRNGFFMERDYLQESQFGNQLFEEPIVIDDKNVGWFRNDVPGTTVDACVSELEDFLSLLPNASEQISSRDDILSQVLGKDRHGYVRTYGKEIQPVDNLAEVKPKKIASCPSGSKPEVLEVQQEKPRILGNKHKSKERKAKKIKVEKDHDMLENPPSSFSLLWDKFGKNFKEVDRNSGVNKMAVKAWNSMSNEDKQHYLDKAAKRKAKHEKLKKKVVTRLSRDQITLFKTFHDTIQNCARLTINHAALQYKTSTTTCATDCGNVANRSRITPSVWY
ncbi:HMG (high mobility group) box protein [Medicago truncatula]|uniref:HMG (High mobility group) box protein n=1 Tax=Medicago truncatula TaxID=3880 RepID=A0A072UHG8_MEDTR|nr:HMG (high mobility group) box protein [Medicago truncatula]